MYDVAIVGFGPSGAVAAALLGQAGLRTYVCDRQTAIYDKPRAISLDHEIMRVFQAIGVAEAVEQYTEPFTPSEYYGVDGQLIKRFTMVPPPYPLGYPPSLVFNQPSVEAVLRERVRAMPTVEIDLGASLESIVQDAGVVDLRVRSPQQDIRSVRAPYVIGCDGASSTVRQLAGLTLDDLGFDQQWLVVDALVNEQGLARLPKVSVQYCEPARPCTYVIGPGNHRRWEISINAGEDPGHVATEAGTWELLRRWLKPTEATLWRQASYRFHALVASSWRTGRVFIAGDAAHQQPPFLGQGMCQGIRDVANLCWKLAAVLEQRASATLLDTYQIERRQHVVDLTTRITAIGAVICERDPARARERDARLLAEGGGVVIDQPRQNVQPALSGGCLAAVDHPARGTIFPQPWIHAGGTPIRGDRVLGAGWALIVAPGTPLPSWPAELGHRLQLTILTLGREGFAETEGVLANWFDRFGIRAALVRPDRYVYGAAADPEQLVREAVSLRSWYPDPTPSRS